MSQDFESQALEFIDSRLSWVSEKERQPLVDLYVAFARFGYLPNPQVAVALEHFLESVGQADLIAAPARQYVDHFFSMHADQARFMFYKGARKELHEDQWRAIERLIMDGLQLERWRPAVSPPERTAEHEPPNQQKRAFDKADFDALMARYFGRDHVYEETEAAMQELMARSRAALLSKLDEEQVSVQDHEKFVQRYQKQFETPLREMIAEVRSGKAKGGLFWLGK